MKITDDEREAAWELQSLIGEILFERERAKLYATVYAAEMALSHQPAWAADMAKRAITDMEKAFALACEVFKEQEHGSPAKAN